MRLAELHALEDRLFDEALNALDRAGYTIESMYKNVDSDEEDRVVWIMRRKPIPERRL